MSKAGLRVFEELAQSHPVRYEPGLDPKYESNSCSVEVAAPPLHTETQIKDQGCTALSPASHRRREMSLTKI